MRIELLCSKVRLIGRRSKVLLCSMVFGLLLVLLCSGKPYLNLSLRAIAISPDEQHIACFEPSAEYKIHCFFSDGSVEFVYTIPVDLSAGGYCTLWFEEDVLCALFHRTNKIAHFALDGSILNITGSTMKESPSKFPSFFIKGHQYVFNGKKIDVVYEKGNILKYWFLDSERYLAITPHGGETKIVYACTAKEGAIEK